MKQPLRCCTWSPVGVWLLTGGFLGFSRAETLELLEPVGLVTDVGSEKSLWWGAKPGQGRVVGAAPPAAGCLWQVHARRICKHFGCVPGLGLMALSRGSWLSA